MKSALAFTSIALSFFAALPQQTQAEEYHLGFRIAPRISTLGGGLEVAQGVTPWLGLRGGANYFTYGYEATESGIDYDLDLNLLSFGLFADIHPFKQAFRISLGFLINGNGIDGNGKPSGTTGKISIGDQDYSLDSIELDLSYNTFAPYVGIGWDTTFGDYDNWGFTFDLGVMFSGSPEAQLTPKGTQVVISDATFQSDLNNEKKQLQDELDSFEFYPVLSTGIVYQF